MTSPLIPISNQIVVLELNQDIDMISKGGLILQTEEANNKNSRKAEVVAVGPGKLVPSKDGTSFTREPVEVNVGDIVIYREYAPMQTTIKGTPYMVLGADNICGIVAKGIYSEEEINKSRKR